MPRPKTVPMPTRDEPEEQLRLAWVHVAVSALKHTLDRAGALDDPENRATAIGNAWTIADDFIAEGQRRLRAGLAP